MKQKNCFWAIAASMLFTAASLTSCSNQDNIIYDVPVDDPVFDFDEGSLIKNGNCEGSNVTNYWVNVGQDAAEFKGNATIKWDGITPKNHCVIVNVRSEEEARAAGNFGTQTWQGGDNTKFEAHDTQFFITFGEENALKENDEIRITMKVMADEPFSAGTGAHGAPGAYITGFGKTVDFTNEWTSWDSGIVKVTKAMAGTYSIAFDLAKGFANKVYFDDIRVEVERYEAPTLLDDWTLVFWNYGKANDAQLSTKYFKNYNATTVEDGVIVVKSLEPGKDYAGQYNNYDNAGNAVDVILKEDHETQLLFSLPQPIKAGTKMKISMKIKADVACDAGGQAHKAIPAPGAVERAGSEYEGTYIYWDLYGNYNTSIPFTTEWETYEKEFTVPSGADGMQAICLNLNKYKDGVNTYYFDDVAIYVEKEEKLLSSVDFASPKGQDGSAVEGYPYWKMGGTYDVVDGVLVITNESKLTNNYDSQPYIIDWVTLETGKNYKVRITMAASGDGKATLHYGSWNGGHMDQEFSFTASEDFKKYDIEFPSSTVSSANDVHICFQSGWFVGTIKIKKVEIFEY